MKNTPIPIVISLLLAVSACSSGRSSGTLQVKADYTADHVVRAFERRYLIPKPPTPPLPVTIEGRTQMYSGLAQAVQAAADGDVIRLGAGVFQGSAMARDKNLRIVGEGAGQTIVVSSETALLVQGGNVHVSDVGFWSLTVGPDVAVAAVSSGQATFEDCRFSGATGPGLLISGQDAKVDLFACLLVGNMGGALRVQGGSLTSRRNVYTRNALAGIVLEPSTPESITGLSFWHDTIVDNWNGHRCLSFLLSGIVRLDVSNSRVTIADSILNSTGIGQSLSDAFASELQEGRQNFLSVEPLPAPQFFVDPPRDDFRPRALIIQDPMGAELGAVPSDEGLEQIRSKIRSSLLAERLQFAYALALFLPPAERRDHQKQIQDRVYSWVSDFMNSGRLGSRLLVLLGLLNDVPEDWKLPVLVDRLLNGFVARYTYGIRPMNFFDNNTAIGETVVSVVMENALVIPRFLTPFPDGERSFILSGEVLAAPTLEREARGFSVTQKMDNPHYARLKEALVLLQKRKDEQDRKVQDLQFRLNNPHIKGNKNSRYRLNQEQRLEQFKKESAEMGRQLSELQAQLEQSQPVFELTLTGQIISTRGKGEFSAQLVVAPEGGILLDVTRKVAYSDTSLAINPLPQFGYEGISETQATADPDKLMGKAVARQILVAIVQAEARVLEGLLARYRQGIITSQEEDQLVELLLLNALLYQRAVDAREEYLALRQLRGDDAPQLSLSYNSDQGVGEAGIQISVSYQNAQDLLWKLGEMEELYQPLWKLQPAIDDYLRNRFSLTPTLFLKARKVMDDLTNQGA